MAEPETFRPSLWLLPLHGLVLLALHLLHAVVALLDHLIHRPWASYDPRTPLGTLRALHAASRRWSKRPTHVALVYTTPLDLAPLRPLRRRRRARDERRDVRRTAEEAARICEWCMELGVERVSIFDRQGAPERLSGCEADRAGVIKHHVAQFAIDFERALKPTCARIGGVASFNGAQLPLFTLGSSLRPEAEVRLAILSPDDGKPHLARVASSLGDAVVAGHISLDEITPGMMQAKLYGAIDAPVPLADRGSVVGARDRPARRAGRRTAPTAGLPAMAPTTRRDLVRRRFLATPLTSRSHEPSLGLLGPARLSFRTFVRALDAYAGCQQRFGR